MGKSKKDIFNTEELLAIQSARNEIDEGNILYATLDVLTFHLPEAIRTAEISSIREAPSEWRKQDYEEDLLCDSKCDLKFEAPVPDFFQASVSCIEPKRQWYVGMTSRFVKDIEKYDRKIQGRILLTLSDILENPITPKGDTLKPLAGDLKGLWRYRIGDFRLVYLPDPKKNVITLLAFTGRGDIYESLQVA